MGNTEMNYGSEMTVSALTNHESLWADKYCIITLMKTLLSANNRPLFTLITVII